MGRRAKDFKFGGEENSEIEAEESVFEIEKMGN